ncbi:MAG: 50S ribosomal protein L21 [Magnetococcales bacterium]|nr:50S ribosomal protein L21 [Magnetococcales bacterium]
MYAVVRTGGKQYKMAVNDVVRVEKLPGAEGEEIHFDDVLLVSADGGVKAGAAAEQSRVTGTILRQFRDKKVLVFKKKRRKNYRRTHGHRQHLTELRVTAITP